MKKLLVISVSIFFSIVTIACEPSEDCLRDGPNYPCPTWSNPGRTCASKIEDPICVAGRAACRGKFATCVTTALIAYNVVPTCPACVIADVETGGSVTPSCIGLCSLAAGTIEILVQNCK